ncbi:hypothetical protein GTQ99_21590 [Kineococcus sp. T13]|nr:hypothetical protein [Kineococcus vitellinus]
MPSQDPTAGTSASPDPGTGGGTGAPAPGAPAAADGELTVVLDDGAGTSTTWTLTCSADGTAGGDHPDAAAACAALGALADPFAPVPRGTACTQVYGGPQRASVSGRWAGRDVSATFERTDGCEISRWDRLAALLQPGAGAPTPLGPA